MGEDGWNLLTGCPRTWCMTRHGHPNQKSLVYWPWATDSPVDSLGVNPHIWKASSNISPIYFSLFFLLSILPLASCFTLLTVNLTYNLLHNPLLNRVSHLCGSNPNVFRASIFADWICIVSFCPLSAVTDVSEFLMALFYFRDSFCCLLSIHSSPVYSNPVPRFY